jgi:hypothetical protein
MSIGRADRYAIRAMDVNGYLRTVGRNGAAIDVVVWYPGGSTISRSTTTTRRRGCTSRGDR